MFRAWLFLGVSLAFNWHEPLIKAQQLRPIIQVCVFCMYYEAAPIATPCKVQDCPKQLHTADLSPSDSTDNMKGDAEDGQCDAHYDMSC